MPSHPVPSHFNTISIPVDLPCLFNNSLHEWHLLFCLTCTISFFCNTVDPHNLMLLCMNLHLEAWWAYAIEQSLKICYFYLINLKARQMVCWHEHEHCHLGTWRAYVLGWQDLSKGYMLLSLQGHEIVRCALRLCTVSFCHKQPVTGLSWSLMHLLSYYGLPCSVGTVSWAAVARDLVLKKHSQIL
jgi:hypothetical protein